MQKEMRRGDPSPVRRILRLVGEQPQTPAGFLAEDGRLNHQTIVCMVQATDVHPTVLRECVVIRLYLPDCNDGALAPDADRNLACLILRDFSPQQTEAYLRLLQIAKWSITVRQRGDKVPHLAQLNNLPTDGEWVEDRAPYGRAGQHLARRAFALRQPRDCPVGALCQPTVSGLKLSWHPVPSCSRVVTAEMFKNGVERFPSGTLMTFAVRLDSIYPLWGMLPSR